MRLTSKISLQLIGFLCALTWVPSVLAGSLWREAVTDEKGMYADKVARRIGDIVTIVVSENSVGTNSLTLKSTKTGTGSNGLAGNLVGT